MTGESVMKRTMCQNISLFMMFDPSQKISRGQRGDAVKSEDQWRKKWNSKNVSESFYVVHIELWIYYLDNAHTLRCGENVLFTTQF